MTLSGSSKDVQYTDLINESVHTNDDIDIGDIEAVSRDFLVVKRGFINIHYYYIPISKVKGWDGNVLWLNIKEDEIKKKYERNFSPDPYRYYTKEQPYYVAPYYPPVTMISPFYVGSRVIYGNADNETSTYMKEMHNIIQCPLCEKRFQIEDELTVHVNKIHS